MANEPARPSGQRVPQTGICPECGFDWSRADYELLVGQCVHDVALFGDALSRIDPSAPVRPGLWSASRYVWHTVDVLRFGTERLWTLDADSAFGVPPWDENEIAEARRYDALSPVVGLIALVHAVRTWQQAALEAPRDVPTPHPDVVELRAFDIVQSNTHEVTHHRWDISRQE